MSSDWEFKNRKAKESKGRHLHSNVYAIRSTQPVAVPPSYLTQARSYSSGAVLKASTIDSKTKIKELSPLASQGNEIQNLSRNLGALQSLHSRLRFVLRELEDLILPKSK